MHRDIMFSFHDGRIEASLDLEGGRFLEAETAEDMVDELFRTTLVAQLTADLVPWLSRSLDSLPKNRMSDEPIEAPNVATELEGTTIRMTVKLWLSRPHNPDVIRGILVSHVVHAAALDIFEEIQKAAASVT